MSSSTGTYSILGNISGHATGSGTNFNEVWYRSYFSPITYAVEFGFYPYLT